MLLASLINILGARTMMKQSLHGAPMSRLGDLENSFWTDRLRLVAPPQAPQGRRKIRAYQNRMTTPCQNRLMS